MAKFKIQDRVYEFDGLYTTEEAMLYWDKAKVGMPDLGEQFRIGNPYVAVTLMYILKRRAGEAVRWEDLVHVPVSEFTVLPADSAPDPAEGSEGTGEAPDPTKDAGTTPASDTTNT